MGERNGAAIRVPKRMRTIRAHQKTRRLFLLTASLAALSAALPGASGKCPLDLYVFKGKVKGSCGGEAIAGAKIFVFLDHPKSGAAEYAGTEYTGTGESPDFALSRLDGGFEAKARFDSDRRSFFRLHNCTARPAKVVIFALAGHYLAKRVTLDWKKLRTSERPDGPCATATVVELPEIRLMARRRGGEADAGCGDEAESGGLGARALAAERIENRLR